MKRKLLLLLSSFFLLAGCASNEGYTPTHGGTYDPERDDPVVTPVLTGLGRVSAPESIEQDGVLSTDSINVLANYSDGTIVEVHPESVSLDTSTLGEATGSVVYKEFTASFTINVVEKEVPPTPEKVISSIEVLTAPTSIKVGEVVLLKDVTIRVTYSDGTDEEKNPTSIKLDTSEAGEKVATVGYLGKNATFNIVVEGDQPISIVGIGGIDVQSRIKLNETLALNDVYVEIIYSDDSTGFVNPTEIVLDTSSVGIVTGIVKYEEFSKEFSIEVYEEKEPDPILVGLGQVYILVDKIYVGDSLSTTNFFVDANYSDGATYRVTPDSVSVDTSAEGTFQGSLSYKDLNTTFTYVVNKEEEEEEEEEDIIYCTYNIYFSYSHTTTMGPKKDVDDPLLSFTAPMMEPLGKAPEAIRSAKDETKVDEAKFLELGTKKGYRIDPAFPKFIGLSYHGLCLTDDDLWDFTTDWKQVAVVNLYGIWVSE